jgi:peptide/nickel transport system substrate-binding protein
MKRPPFRFISDPAAQVAALLSGDVDAFPRVAAARSLEQFKGNPRFQVIISGSRAKTILAINNKRKPLTTCGCAAPSTAAIDRKAVIEGAATASACPSAAIYVPGAFGYVDTTGVNPYNPAKARAVAEAGVKTPLELTMKLPPGSLRAPGRRGHRRAAGQGRHRRQAAERRMGAVAVSGVYGNKNYDLTIINARRAVRLRQLRAPGYYWGYESPKFNEIYDKINNAPRAADRAKLLGDAQRMLANDAVHAFLYQPQWITVAQKGIRACGRTCRCS